MRRRLIVPALALAASAGFLPGTRSRADEAEVTVPAGPAVTPGVVFYQGRLTDSGGAPRTGTATLHISLYSSAAATEPLWTETHNLVPLTDGIFSLLLGSLTPFPASAWTEPDRYLGVAVDDGEEMSPRLRIASVPFAMEANRLNGKRSTDFEPTGAAAIAAAGLAANLKGTDNDPPNLGSNQVHWNNLHGVPGTFADGVDDEGSGVAVHGQLQGLTENDHPQYTLATAMQISDGNAPNLGSNRVHWDNLGGVPGPLAAQLLPAAWIQPGAVDSARLATAGVASKNLAPGSVSAAHLAPGSVGPAQVADASLTGADVQNESLTGADVQNSSLTGLDIQDESIFTNDIQNATILGVDMAPGAVGSPQVADGSLTGGDMAENSIDGSRLMDGAVTASKVAPGAVGPGALAAGAVTGSVVVDGSLSSQDLGDAPGIAFLNVPGFVDTVADESFGQTIRSITLQAPGDGYVLVSADAQVFLLHDVGTTSRLTMAVSAVPDNVPNETAGVITIPGSLVSDIYQYSLSADGVFPVTGAGPVTFYLTGQKGSQIRHPSLHNLRFKAIFFARQY